MTSKTCSRKANPALSFFGFTLKKQTPFSLLALAVTLLICPTAIIRSIMDFEPIEGVREYEMAEVFGGMSVFVFIASVAIMLILIMVNFGFLFSKRAGDIYHPLPLTRNGLLFIRAIPSLIGGIFNATVGYIGLAIANCLPKVIPVPAEALLTAYLLMLLFLAVIWAFSLIFVTLVGGYFDFIIAIGAINLGLPALTLIFMSLFEGCAVGLSADYEAVIYTTPFAYTVYKLLGATLPEDRLEVFQKFGPLSAVLSAVFIMACLIVTVKLFSIRRSETAGEAYSFRFVPHIIGLFVSVCGGYLIAYLMTVHSFDSFDFWPYFIFGAIICSTVFGAITTRGFKTVKASLIRGGIGVLLSAVIALTVGLSATSVAYELPKSEDIKKIELVSGLGYNTASQWDEDFEVILSLHKGIVENIKEDYHDDIVVPPDIIGNFGDFHIIYTLKNGQRLERRYWYSYLNRDNLYDEVLALMQTDGFYGVFYDRADTESQIMLSSYNWEEENNYSGYVDGGTAKSLLDTYKKEMRAADESIFGEGCRELYIESEGYYERIMIPESFSETLALVDSVMTADTVEMK